MRTKRIVKADVEAEIATMTDEQVTEAVCGDENPGHYLQEDPVR